MIFGPNNKNYMKSGNTVFGPNGMTARRSGNVTHVGGVGGDSILHMGKTSFCHHGTIMRQGSTWNAPRGQYRLSGSTLFGPGGKIWHNVSPDDVPLLIHDDD